MGLYIGDKQVDMFSLLHGNSSVKAAVDLPPLDSMRTDDIGRAFCIISGGNTEHVVGHIYQLQLKGTTLEYADLIQVGGISAFYNMTTKEMIV